MSRWVARRCRRDHPGLILAVVLHFSMGILTYLPATAASPSPISALAALIIPKSSPHVEIRLDGQPVGEGTLRLSVGRHHVAWFSGATRIAERTYELTRGAVITLDALPHDAIGLLTVSSNPTDAIVTAFRESFSFPVIGTTPLPPGRFRLHVTRRGYADDTQEVTVEAGKELLVRVGLASASEGGFSAADSSNWGAVLLVIISAAAMLLAAQAQYLVRIEKTADILTREWWSLRPSSGDVQTWIDAFYRYRDSLRDNVPATIAQIKNESPDTGTLLFFFDRLGWLCAWRLINPDYVLPPMQHTLTRLWLLSKDAIYAQRDCGVGGLPDPVYHLGLEWLARLSARRAYSHKRTTQRTFGPFAPWRRGLRWIWALFFRPSIIPKNKSRQVRWS